MIRIFTNCEYLTQEHRSKIFPLFLNLFYKQDIQIKAFYEIVEDIKMADILVLPLEHQYIEQLDRGITNRWYDLAVIHKKLFWVYTGGDFGYTFKNKRLLFNFRVGGFKSKQDKQTIIMPSFLVNPYGQTLKQDFKPLAKSDMPKIGFVGHANGSFIKKSKDLLSYFKINLYNRAYRRQPIDYQPFYPSSKKRFQFLKRLEQHGKIETDFILRKEYRAGARTKIQIEKTTLEFFKNILNNPYTLCVRGAGNFSVRFYETLAMGRIPVFLSTDSPLPLEHLIDWKTHALYIDENDFLNMEQLIIKFHEQISNEDFEKLQISNRVLWQDSLVRTPFFIHIYHYFKANYIY